MQENAGQRTGPAGANLTAYRHKMAKSVAPFEVWECVGMGVCVESDDKTRCDETHLHTPTHSHTWRDDLAAKFDDLSLSSDFLTSAGF